MKTINKVILKSLHEQLKKVVHESLQELEKKEPNRWELMKYADKMTGIGQKIYETILAP
jgi:hypothetical protein